MKLNLILVLCLTGLVPVAVSILTTTPHKYDLIMSQVTWSNAQNYCRVIYNDLATIQSDTDWLRLNKGGSKSPGSSAWVGLYNDINSWRWSLDDLPLKNVTYTYWMGGRPNNVGGKASCVMMGTYATWYDADCTIKGPFVCYNANFSGASKFIGVTTSLMTWLGAQEYCRRYHTDLASALNRTDSNYLWNLRDIQGDSWIGLYRDTWKWSDGTNASNLQWASGQPDNYFGNENCAVVSDGLFSDESCTKVFYFFCQTISPVRNQQIMKLQVTSDGSVLDPAVQSSILEHIKQKLEEKGMLENTTVKWRVPNDGKVFRKKKKDDL